MSPTGTFEIAPSGRARCRGCGRAIAKGEIRFGERMPNPFGDGEMTLWFHPRCAAYKRPEPFLDALSSDTTHSGELSGRESLIDAARCGAAHRRLPRLSGAERAPSGRARCRSCRTLIDKQSWRFSLVYYEEGRFEPAGFIHAGCAPDYFETTVVTESATPLVEGGELLVERAAHFSQLDDADRLALAEAVAGGGPSTSPVALP